MKKVTLITLLACCLFFTACNGCGNTKKQKSQPSTTEDVADSAKYVSGEWNKAALSRVDVYFDNSASMAGYVNANVSNTTFFDAITALGQDLGGGKLVFSGNLCCKGKDDKAAIGNLDYEKFRTMIQNGKVTTGSESMLNEIIGNIANSNLNNPGTLSVLFTDGILSEPAKEIKKKPEFTRREINDLKSSLRNSLDGKGLAAAVYRFNNAGFIGAYYYYDNSNKYISGTRPLFAVVLGSPVIVKEFKNWVESKKGENFKYSYAAYALEKLPIGKGLNYPYATITPDNKLEYSRKGLKTKHGGNLELKLPMEVFEGQFQKGQILVDSLAKKVEVLVGSVPAKDVVSVADNAICITIPDNLIGSQKDIRISMPYSEPQWIKDGSISDDKASYSDFKTLFQDKFVSAIMEGVSGGSPDYLFDQTISIKTK